MVKKGMAFWSEAGYFRPRGVKETLVFLIDFAWLPRYNIYFSVPWDDCAEKTGVLVPTNK
ncbi:MAG: hypothetical protein V1782_11735 [Pseudomonadota bacterium]